MTRDASRDAAYFERIYDKNADPWQFATSDYERRKYDATLYALSGRRFANALEIGCSIGVLTRHLAPQCDALLGVDIAETPLRMARERCADAPHVSFLRGAVPGEWPGGEFDLVVLSEVLYFLSPSDITIVAERVRESLSPSGCVVLVNWLGVADNPISGDDAAEAFLHAAAAWRIHDLHWRTADYRLDVLERVST